MKKLLLLSLSVLFWACQSSPTEKAKGNTEEITYLEDQMQALDYLDTTLAAQLVAAYSEYVAEQPKDSLSPIYLRKTAEIYRAWPGKHGDCEQTYRKLHEAYRFHPEGKQALLRLGIFFEEQGLKDRADAAYKSFIRQYPSDPLAEQARQMHELLQDQEEILIQKVQDWKKKANQ